MHAMWGVRSTSQIGKVFMHVRNQPFAPNGRVAVRGEVDGQRAHSTLSAKHARTCSTAGRHPSHASAVSRNRYNPHTRSCFPFASSQQNVKAGHAKFPLRTVTAHGLSMGCGGVTQQESYTQRIETTTRLAWRARMLACVRARRGPVHCHLSYTFFRLMKTQRRKHPSLKLTTHTHTCTHTHTYTTTRRRLQ